MAAATEAGAYKGSEAKDAMADKAYAARHTVSEKASEARYAELANPGAEAHACLDRAGTQLTRTEGV